MKFSNILVVGLAAVALVACSKKDDDGAAPQTEASAKAAKTDSASPLDSGFKLKNAEAVDIDKLLALIPAGARPSYDRAEFDEKLGATVVTNLKFADAKDGESVNVERAEFFGVDLDAIDRIKAATDAGVDAPFETVFQKVRLLNVSANGFEDGEGAFSIGGVEFDQMAIRQGGVEGTGSGNEAARFFNAVNLAGLYFKDFSLAANEADAASVALAAPDLRFVGLSGGRLGAIIANGLSYQVDQSPETLAQMGAAMGPQGAMILSSPLRNFIAPANQSVEMKSMEWRDIDFSGLMGWGLKGEEPPVSAKDLIDLGTVKATDIVTQINGKKAATLDEATISAAEFTWLIPSKFRADSKGAVYDFTAYAVDGDEDTLAVLNEYGLDNVTGDGFAEWNWNTKSGVGDFDYVANMNGFADIAMGFGLGGLKLDDIAAAQENGADNVVAALGTLNGLSLTLADEKALDAIFALSALQMGGSGEDLRASASGMIRLAGAQGAMMNPKIAAYVDAVADFVARGGTLEIVADPADPVAFSALQSGAVSPATLPDVLGLTVTHKEKK
ncbi:MAG: hypothetical protein DHS20C05_19150 [Hyphococcus sp.]|nr:MAG: hypothetical protein DHS20C05_19150 [Marinicaulis sp.]